MILRKPYALLIKHFKLIHLVMTLLITYLIYRTSNILTFLNEYISNSPIVIGTELTDPLFDFLLWLVPIFIVVSSIIIISVMYVKKKPLVFYLFTIVFYIALIVIYSFANNTIGTMELKLIDVRTVRALRDIMNMAFVIQCISVIITFIRATGFDIKKFNFGKDLAELDIKVEDSEEFEVDVEIDTNKARRKTNYLARHAMYYYKENKFMIQIASLLFLAFVCFLIYSNIDIYHKTLPMTQAFMSKDVTMQIENAFLLDSNYRGEKITNEGISLVVLRVRVKRNNITVKKLETARTALYIKDVKLYPVNTYRDSLIDLGTSYENQELTADFSRFILVYEVPNHLLNEKMQFNYINQTNYKRGRFVPDLITLDLNVEDLRKVKKKIDVDLDEENTFVDNILKGSKFKITSADIKEEYALKYQLCTNESCYSSVEYVKPNPISLTPKALLRLKMNLALDENVKIRGVVTPFNLINTFATITYKIGDKDYTLDSFTLVNPTRVKLKDEYLIEVPSNMLSADEIILHLNIRNYEYLYLLK